MVVGDLVLTRPAQRILVCSPVVVMAQEAIAGEQKIGESFQDSLYHAGILSRRERPVKKTCSCLTAVRGMIQHI
jgi:hypothetical protein